MGFGLWRFWVESPARSDANQLIEWLPPTFSPELWPFWLIAAALPVLTLVRWRHLDPQTVRLAAIAIGVMPLAFQAIRNVHVFLIAALPAMSCVIASGRPERHRRATGEHERVNAALLGGAAAFAAVVVLLAWMRPPDMLGWRPISPAAVAAIRDCGGPMFNTYGQGGILTWFVPEKPVFIDNRQDPFPMDLLAANHDVEFGADPEPLFERYGIRCAVVPPDSALVARLTGDPAWSSLYADAEWAVFSREAQGPTATR
jgi:hypothetical protein